MDCDRLFYGFRGNISFPNQATIFNLEILNDSSSKNKLFYEFFEHLEKSKMLQSKYQNRVYYVIFKNKYDNVLHCVLARKKSFNKRELTDEHNIIDVEDDDYPYINVFIELQTQKFMIESNTQVFDNYNTCSSVMANIINHYFEDRDIRIELNPILEEESFWYYFDSKISVFNIEFNLCTPNIFDGEDDVTSFLKEAEKNVNANKVNMNLCNTEGKLIPHRLGIDSYIKYICNGGGEWKLTIMGENGRKQKISSKQKSTKVHLPLDYEELKRESLSNEKIMIIKERFKSIENVEKFKGN